jgi:hypothetical protein
MAEGISNGTHPIVRKPPRVKNLGGEIKEEGGYPAKSKRVWVLPAVFNKSHNHRGNQGGQYDFWWE